MALHPNLRRLLAAVLVSLASLSTGARTARGQCSVSGPPSAQSGDLITFTSDAQGDGLSYDWTVSRGEIVSGQGTPTISVDTSGLSDTTVTASAHITGANFDCTASHPTQINRVPLLGPRPRQFDEFRSIAFDDDKARLDNLAIELQNDPTSTGYVIIYGGRRSRPGDAQRRADRSERYLVNMRGIDASRITTVDGGFREAPTIELWVAPVGAGEPPVTPTLDPSEVLTARPRGGRRGRRRR